MPKVTYTAAKGLFQSAGSGLDIAGEVRGAKKKIIQTTTTLTLAESGAVLAPVAGAAQTFTLPDVTTAAGFEVTFYAGSAQAHVVNGGGAKFQGVNYHNSNTTTFARAAISNRSSLTLQNGAVGDHMTIVGDGTNYYVFSWTNNALTLA